MTSSPFLKIEATKFTEVGYVGKDVESIIKDLLNISIKLCFNRIIYKLSKYTKSIAQEKIIDIICFPCLKIKYIIKKDLKVMLKNGLLDDKLIKIKINHNNIQTELKDNGFDNTLNQLKEILSNTLSDFQKSTLEKIDIKNAIKLISNNEAIKIINKEEIIKAAIKYTESNGIIFIDELDKIISNKKKINANVSREGVQRDILPIVEGCQVYTKFGLVDTSDILFIAAGAFYNSHPSDLMPELQGRFPIQIYLDKLNQNDFIDILKHTNNNLIKQYQSLLLSDSIFLNFDNSGIIAISKITAYINSEIENIGARRLYTILEYLLQHESFYAPFHNKKNKTIKIDKNYVNKKLFPLIKHNYIKNNIL